MFFAGILVIKAPSAVVLIVSGTAAMTLTLLSGVRWKVRHFIMKIWHVSLKGGPAVIKASETINNISLNIKLLLSVCRMLRQAIFIKLLYAEFYFVRRHVSDLPAAFA